MRANTLLVVLSAMYWSSLHAAVLTVGPDGTYATVQTAVADAIGMPGDDEIRVQAGTYSETVSIVPGGGGDTLTLIGGWNMMFTTHSGAGSIIDAGGIGRVVDVYLEGGDQLLFSGFTVTGGLRENQAGMAVYLNGASNAEISGNRFTANLAVGDRASDAGLYFNLNDDAYCLIQDNEIDNNEVESVMTVDARGGGLSGQASGNSRVEIRNNRILDNQVRIAGGGSTLGGGMDIGLYGGAGHEISDNLIAGNTLDGGNGTGTGMILLGSEWTLRRNRFEDNLFVPGLTHVSQVVLSIWADGTGIFTDNLVTGGNGRAVSANVSDTAVAHLTNLTIAGHPERGLLGSLHDPGAGMTVFNSIVTGNSPDLDLDPDAVTGSNFIGGDPLFTDPGAGNYRLESTSPAVDIGDNTPPGGLGALDLDGNPRLLGPGVDAGAYERTDELFSDGFETTS